jgi:hypothetical protein
LNCRTRIHELFVSSPMQVFLCVLTSLVFASHALLGCGVHRTCEHRTAILADSAATNAKHHCDTHHDGHEEEPGDPQRESSEPCSHSACSYVKGETQRIDSSKDVVALWAAMAPIASNQADAVTASVRQPVCQADFSSTQLYVWHCALII